MKNSIPYSLISTLLMAKVFAWWLLIWGSNILDVEFVLKSMFEPIHAFSYMVLTSVLVIGLVFGSKFSLIVFIATAPVNLLIYVLNGNIVYQSIWDPIILTCFIMAVILRKPNKWLPTVGINKKL